VHWGLGIVTEYRTPLNWKLDWNKNSIGMGWDGDCDPNGFYKWSQDQNVVDGLFDWNGDPSSFFMYRMIYESPILCISIWTTSRLNSFVLYNLFVTNGGGPGIICKFVCVFSDILHLLHHLGDIGSTS